MLDRQRAVDNSFRLRPCKAKDLFQRNGRAIHACHRKVLASICYLGVELRVA
jgi:hypothetical protein